MSDNLSNQGMMVYLEVFEFSESCFRLVKPTPRPTLSAIATRTSTASATTIRAVRDFCDDGT